MARKQSVFSSTKQLLQDSVNLSSELFALGTEELSASRKLNKVENLLELTETKLTGLQELTKLDVSGLDKKDIEAIMSGVKETIISIH